ncbi:MAG: hypothetical protein RG741_10790 [Bacteroidales bacterium]|nr:hypothetical protein [Bacteroidales bacterium]
MMTVDYPNILDLISDYNITGRTESAAFLMWYLENYYRLSQNESIDSVCDQSGDKGVDGIYLNEATNTIDVFQTKISQTPGRTIGDAMLKEFVGTLAQFSSKDNLQHLVDTAGDAQVAGLINRLDLIEKLEAYNIKGVFVTNIDIDFNGESFLKASPNIEFVGKTILESTYISSSKDIPIGRSADFDISGISTTKYHVDTNTKAIIAPIKSTELVQMQGIADQSVFAYNVRGPLGKTNVNKDIEKSIRDCNGLKNLDRNL